MSVSSTQPPSASSPPPARPRRLPPVAGIQRVLDVGFRLLCRVSALLVLALMLLLIGVLAYYSIPAIKKYGFGFLVINDWNPQGQLGALPFIFGTLVTSAIGMLIAVPLGVGAAAFLAEIASGWIRRIGSFLIELLAAIPSVVYGFWGFFYLKPRVQWLSEVLGNPTTGNGLLCAGVILSIMILPYITAITFDVCRAVPRSQREGSLALGSTRWQMIWSVILPYARPGIVGGCFLALGRALGETMAVMMLIGNRNEINLKDGIFSQGATVASVIATELNESADLKKSALVYMGLVLLFVTVLVNCCARILIWQVGRRGKRRSIFNWRRSAVTAHPGANGQPETRQIGAPTTSQQLNLGRSNQFSQIVNIVMTVVLAACVVVTVIPLFLILFNITVFGIAALDWSFFTNLPNDMPPGLGHAIYGSAMLVALATLCAVPPGILAAVFLVEYKTSRLAPIVRFVGELLGGVPSIVIGILGYYLLVEPLRHFSGWAGIFALGVMMIPIVMRATEEALKLVPSSLRSASYALGAAHWQTVVRVTVPAALPAIITGVFLAIARIAGETAPLLLTADSSNYWRFNPNQPTPFLTYYINKYFSSPLPEEQRLSWAAAFVLLTLVMFLNIGIRLATGKRQVLAARAD
jgi:phosphate transport system permease protein